MKIDKSMFLIAAAGAALSLSCKSEKSDNPPAPSGMTEVSYTPGEAGGVIESKFTATARVSKIDKSSRKVTLTTSDGRPVDFTAGPEIRNFDQLKVGDNVEATISERLVAFVRKGSEDPAVAHAAALATAPKGAKPGALVAEAYEITASVQSIDTSARRATLLFADGQARTVSIRPDVEMSRYKVGDTVVIRVINSLSLIAEKP